MVRSSALIVLAAWCVMWGGIAAATAQEAEQNAPATQATEAANQDAAAANAAAPDAAADQAADGAGSGMTSHGALMTSSQAPHLTGMYDTGSTAWLLVSAALVFFMMPGLALFYGGMVRAKNVLNMFMCVMVCVPIVTVQWVAYGYSLAFSTKSVMTTSGGDNNELKMSWLGWDNDLAFLQSFSNPARDNIDFYGKVAATGDTVGAAPNGVPELLFAMFQMMFAIITPALIVGALAERVKFSAWCVFVLLWATVVYDPVCHWVWNVNGWLFQKGVYDFAGGTVVHLLAGISALALIVILPKRRGYPAHPMMPHSIGWTLIGAGLLMVGWFGFNAGSAIAVGKDYLPVAGDTAVLAFATTAIAGSAAAGSWLFVEWLKVGKPTALGLASGMVAGLVTITPCAGHVSPAGALIIGLIGGVVCFLAVQLKPTLKYDDSLDVVGVHGVGGALGAVLVGYFAVRPAPGNLDQVMLQLQGIGAAGLYAFVCTLVLGILVNVTIGFTVDEKTEEEGLDLAEHGEVGYRLS